MQTKFFEYSCKRGEEPCERCVRASLESQAMEFVSHTNTLGTRFHRLYYEARDDNFSYVLRVDYDCLNSGHGIRSRRKPKSVE